MAAPKSKMLALVVAKSSVLIRNVERNIRQFGDFELEIHDNVRDALQVVFYQRPDFIVSEWQLTDHSVLQLLQIISSKVELKSIPVIVWAAPEFKARTEEVKNLGAKVVLNLPFNDDKFQRALRSLVSLDSNLNTGENKVGNVSDDAKRNLVKEISRIQQTASLPAIVPQILQVTNDPKSSAKILGEVIKKDQSLTAKILKIVNSAFYGLYRKVGNVDHAIVILGFNEIRNISLAACLIKAHKGAPNPHFDQNNFWLHSLCTAYVARELSKIRPELNTADAFVVGLLHDFGKVILYQFFNDLFQRIINQAYEENRPLYQVSREIVEIDHAQIGGIIGENWKLPQHLVKAVEYHHKPNAALRHEYEIHLAHLANCFCHKYGFGESGNPVPDEFNQESLEIFKLQDKNHDQVWDSLNIEKEALQEFLEMSLA